MAQNEPATDEAPKPRARRASSPHQPEPASAGMSPEELARALRAVAAELERDPALARRVASAIAGEAGNASDIPDARVAHPRALEDSSGEPEARIGRTFQPSIVMGIAPELGAGIPDPFELRARLGLDGLRQALESLRLGSLRAIVREHKLDPGGRLSKLNDAAKLRERIIQAVTKRS